LFKSEHVAVFERYAIVVSIRTRARRIWRPDLEQNKPRNDRERDMVFDESVGSRQRDGMGANGGLPDMSRR